MLLRLRKSGNGAQRKCRFGSLPPAIGGIPEKLCSPRVLLTGTNSDICSKDADYCVLPSAEHPLGRMLAGRVTLRRLSD